MKQTLEFSSQAKELACVRDFVRTFLSHTDLAERDTELLVLGIDEACSNIIRHAYGHRPSQPITLTCERLRGKLRFKLRDFGEQLVPGSMKARPLDRIEPGGLGLHIIHHAFDEVDYTLKPQGTELRLVKKLPAKRKKQADPGRGSAKADGAH